MLSAIVAAAFAMAAIMPTGADSTPPPGKITIEVVTVNGSGCPAGTPAADDNTAFTVTYSHFLAWPEATPTRPTSGGTASSPSG